jgi:hypothetical protein
MCNLKYEGKCKWGSCMYVYICSMYICMYVCMYVLSFAFLYLQAYAGGSGAW